MHFLKHSTVLSQCLCVTDPGDLQFENRRFRGWQTASCDAAACFEFEFILFFIEVVNKVKCTLREDTKCTNFK